MVDVDLGLVQGGIHPSISLESFMLAVRAAEEVRGQPFRAAEDCARYVSGLRATLQEIIAGVQPTVESIGAVEKFFERYGALQFRRAQAIKSASTF